MARFLLFIVMSGLFNENEPVDVVNFEFFTTGSETHVLVELMFWNCLPLEPTNHQVYYPY